MEVRVVTINLAGIKYGWFEQRMQVLIRGLADLDPDLLCLQEATTQTHPRAYHQAAALGEALGLSVVAFAPYGNPAEIMSPAQGGVAFVSRWPIRQVENRRLPMGHRLQGDNRVALLATLLTPEGDLHLATTHLSWRPEESETRLIQTTLLLEYLSCFEKCRPEGRLIFAGDLNAPEGEISIERLGEELQDAFRACHPEDAGYTWLQNLPLNRGRPDPDRRLDYIFCSRQAKVLSARVVLNQPDPVYPSDHFGVFAHLSFS